ncbi:uncharacterized protein LOC114714187 isoform X2 [Neltuma alba]|uniref:uncharacterized protein LOC114714187 isoform X2 n=1 Tax=Neltuma alba TaxID=207710 RepID=UPI0010A3B7F8|nr:uncharacterized protein LOC114714187 isoform X2 [Prosopis alba]
MAVRASTVAKLPNLIRSLREGSPKPLNHALPSLRRTFSLYDQINLINNVPEDQLRFQGYNDTGFTVNKVEYEGSLLCVGNLLLSWKPKKFSEITSDRDLNHWMRKAHAASGSRTSTLYQIYWHEVRSYRLEKRSINL